MRFSNETVIESWENGAFVKLKPVVEHQVPSTDPVASNVFSKSSTNTKKRGHSKFMIQT